MSMNKCGCTDDILCKEAKRLWKRRNFAGRKLYSYHRKKALNLLDEGGFDKIHGYSIWANNT
jgi:hypothetical protein